MESRKTKIRIYRTVIQPEVVYGNETCIKTKNDTDKLKILRKLEKKKKYRRNGYQHITQKVKRQELVG